MIPKKIHYCWFGRGQMPELAIKCIDSWKKHLPDYEIIEWNEDNFDINSNQYVKEAYEAKKYAFVTDYIRLYVLYNYGGVYMDTDVEVLKSIDKFLLHRAFTGCENEEMCVTGIMASEANHSWIKELLSYYNDRPFILSDGSYDKTTNTKTITYTTIDKYGWIPRNNHQVLREDLNIYPFDFFCAKSFETGQIKSTKNTYTIHHFSGSWHTKSDKIKRNIIKLLGPKNTMALSSLKKKILG